MQKFEITRTNGNIVRSLAGEDHVSGLLMYCATLPTAKAGREGFTTSERIHAVSSLETAEKMGITADSTDWNMRVLHYHLSAIYAQNPGVSLYVGIYPRNAAFSEIKTMQNYAGGRLRQIGVWDGTADFVSGKTGAEATAAAQTTVNALQTVRTTLEAQGKPLCILYAPQVKSVTNLPTEVAKKGNSGVSVVIAQDCSGVAAELYKADANKTAKASVSAIGEVLGTLSKAKVHHSIAWVEQYPTNIALAGFGDGTQLRSLDSATVETLDKARYIFALTYEGIAGAYWNDNHTMDDATSDYAYISDVRTMDKAERGVRTYLQPKLGRPMKVDAATGKLERTTVEHLITTGNKPLEEMAKADELSGYRFEIDPDQNILATSRVKGVIKNVAVGVMRNLSLEIGFAQSI